MDDKLLPHTHTNSDSEEGISASSYYPEDKKGGIMTEKPALPKSTLPQHKPQPTLNTNTDTEQMHNVPWVPTEHRFDYPRKEKPNNWGHVFAFLSMIWKGFTFVAKTLPRTFGMALYVWLMILTVAACFAVIVILWILHEYRKLKHIFDKLKSMGEKAFERLQDMVNMGKDAWNKIENFAKDGIGVAEEELKKASQKVQEFESNIENKAKEVWDNFDMRGKIMEVWNKDIKDGLIQEILKKVTSPKSPFRRDLEEHLFYQHGLDVAISSMLAAFSLAALCTATITVPSIPSSTSGILAIGASVTPAITCMTPAITPNYFLPQDVYSTNLCSSISTTVPVTPHHTQPTPGITSPIHTASSLSTLPTSATFAEHESQVVTAAKRYFSASSNQDTTSSLSTLPTSAAYVEHENRVVTAVKQ
ncbi:hypothetical protein EJ04DRAFT_129123 [Polyplosphaeria fusca]|uniref:Uncharacterized protein n=1 Tax=Polyplosphaeria fusca TaxID=682080 RepID=A0A9P4QMS6_9PLEO|nr:hypothetical protein EJ04DRAFT_129123 [Polyplosphaeria fusca]